MPRQAGFTIVELSVSLAIIALLLAAALPRFAAFSDRQDILRSAGVLEDCLREAQQEAAAPLSPLASGQTLRYTSASITFSHDPNNPHTECQVSRFPATDSSGTLLTAKTVSDPLTQIDSESSPVRSESTVLAGGSLSVDQGTCPTDSLNSMAVFYGVNEHGLPVALSYLTGLGVPCGTLPASPYAPSLGKGMQISLSLADASNGQTVGTLTSGQYGVPVSFQTH